MFWSPRRCTPSSTNDPKPAFGRPPSPSAGDERPPISTRLCFLPQLPLPPVMDRYVDPLVATLKTMLEYRKFKHGNKAEIDDILRTEKAENPMRIVYSIGISHEHPGTFILSYIRSTNPHHEYIGLYPKGFKFRKGVFDNIDKLVAFFQKHINDPVLPESASSAAARVPMKSPAAGGWNGGSHNSNFNSGGSRGGRGRGRGRGRGGSFNDRGDNDSGSGWGGGGDGGSWSAGNHGGDTSSRGKDENDGKQDSWAATTGGWGSESQNNKQSDTGGWGGSTGGGSTVGNSNTGGWGDSTSTPVNSGGWGGSGGQTSQW